MKTIYTIGYAGFHIEEFVKTLRKYEITVLIDVRTNPHSSGYYQEYSKEALQPVLDKNGIIYRNYAQEFGARQNDLKYFSNGVLDFKKFTSSDIFKNGIEKINKGLELKYKFVLMCAEKDPINCHRNIMITKAMRDIGFKVFHIICDGSLQTQEDIDERLLDLYFKQPSLFEFNMDRKEKLEQAYQKQNEEIGFKEKDIQ